MPFFCEFFLPSLFLFLSRRFPNLWVNYPTRVIDPTFTWSSSFFFGFRSHQLHISTVWTVAEARFFLCLLWQKKTNGFHSITGEGNNTQKENKRKIGKATKVKKWPAKIGTGTPSGSTNGATLHGRFTLVYLSFFLSFFFFNSFSFPFGFAEPAICHAGHRRNYDEVKKKN